jgi:muramoyltetrapeptide carboxypeptidase
MKTIFPLPLQPMDKIAIVSPSGAVNPAYIDGAAARLGEWGFEPVVFPNANNIYGRYAGTISERAADLQQAINDPAIRAILCSRGGYGAIQVIESVDFNLLIRNPKWLIGFSDITVFHAALSGLNIASVHGIMAKQLTENAPQSKPVSSLHEILTGKLPSYSLASHHHPLNRTGQAKGKVIGGNLSVLYGLRGTKYDFLPAKSILFIEDLSERPYHIDRMMRNLQIGGMLEKLSGLIVGQFTEIEEDPLMFKTVYEIIADAVSDYDYPVCFNFPAGHVEQNFPLVMGASATLEVTEKDVFVSWV